MKRFVKHYVEERVMDKFDISIEKEIDDRIIYIKDKYINQDQQSLIFGCRFFDKEVIAIDDKEYVGPKNNYTNWITLPVHFDVSNYRFPDDEREYIEYKSLSEVIVEIENDDYSSVYSNENVLDKKGKVIKKQK